MAGVRDALGWEFNLKAGIFCLVSTQVPNHQVLQIWLVEELVPIEYQISINFLVSSLWSFFLEICVGFGVVRPAHRALPQSFCRDCWGKKCLA